MNSISIKILKIILLLMIGVCLFSIASKVSAFSITPSNPTVTEGEVLTFKVVDDKGKDISRKIRWRSEKTSVATIGYSSGELTAKKAGSVTIKAEHYDTKEIVEFTVTVKEDEKITLNETSITIKKDEKAELIAFNSKGKEISDNDIEWKSSDEKVAKIQKGEIEAKKVGTATITATNKKTGAKATCIVKVEEEEKIEESEPETPTKPSTPATPAKPVSPTTSTTPTAPAQPITGKGESNGQNTEKIENDDELTMEDELPETEKNEIEEVTSSITNGEFTLNGLIAKIHEIINSIIKFIFENVINGGLNKLFN